MKDPVLRPLSPNNIKYTVQKADTLRKIALYFFQNEELWDFLYLFNCRDDVTKITGCKPLSPNLIYVGQKLLIPSNKKSEILKKKTTDFAPDNSPIDQFARTIKKALDEGVTYNLPDVPGLLFQYKNVSIASKFDGGKLNLKVADENDFSPEHITTTRVETFVDELGKDSHDLFSKFTTGAKVITPEINWDEIKKLKEPVNRRNLDSIKFIKPLKMRYDVGPFSGEWEKDSKEMNIDAHHFTVATANISTKDKDTFCNIEYTFDAPPQFIGLGKVVFTGKACGNLGKQIQGFELSWKDYSAEMKLIIQFDLFDSNFPSGIPIPASSLFSQTSDQFVSSNFGAPKSFDLQDTSYLYTEPGAKSGAAFTNLVASGQMSAKEAMEIQGGALLAAGAASVTVLIAVECALSSSLLFLGKMLIQNSARALAAIGSGSAAVTAYAKPTIPTSDRHMTQKQLTSPALRHTINQKKIPAEFILVSTGKVGAFQAYNAKKNIKIEFKAPK